MYLERSQSSQTKIKIYSRCEGTVGPPCFVQRGDTVLLEVDWANPGVANMTQSTVDMPL